MQEVIVYRNPLEAAIWHALSQGNGLLVFISVIFLGFVWAFAYVIIDKLMLIYSRHYRRGPFTTRYGQTPWVEYTLATAITVAIGYFILKALA